MIITLIAAFVFVVGIVLVIIHDHSWKCGDWALIVGVPLMMMGMLAALFAGAGIIHSQVGKDIHYQNTLYKKEMLEYRIDSMEENIIGNEMLYNDIVEFNNELRSVKKWANSPWTNWFYNEKIADIDYIELNER